MATLTTGTTGQVTLPPILLLIGISALGPIVLNGVIPANSNIVEDLDTSYGMVQLVLTVFLVATMISQIVLGNWADRYGRRPVMIGSLLVFSIGGVICAIAPSTEILLLGRFIQGFGSAVCVFLPRTIVRDVYSRNRSASVIGYITTAMMVAPLFGPALGGWVTDVSTWRWLYAVMALLGFLFTFLSWVGLNETLAKCQVRPAGSRFYDAAYELLSFASMRAYLAIQCGSTGIYYAFLGGAPYVLMELQGLSATDYGQWFMFVAVGYMTGNFIAGRYSGHFGVERMTSLGLIPGLAGLLLFWILSAWSHPLALFLPMQLVALSNGVCLPNLMSACMSVKPELAGSASGIAGTVQMVFAIAVTLLLSLLLHATALPLYLIFTVSGAITATGYWRMRQLSQKEAQDL